MRKPLLAAWFPGLLPGLVSAVPAAGAPEADGAPVSSAAPDPSRPAGGPVPPVDRAALERELQALAQGEPDPIQARESMAMCYDMAEIDGRAEYVCPICGERTVYAASGDPYRSPDDRVSDAGWSLVVADLVGARRLVAEAQAAMAGRGVDLLLDERQLCRRCMPTVMDPALVLRVTLAGQVPFDVVGVRSQDLRFLREWLVEKNPAAREALRTSPLADAVSRIERALAGPPSSPPKGETPAR